MTFIVECGKRKKHKRHVFVKIWVRDDLAPYLPNPETYPERWSATYICPGRKKR